MSNGNGPSGAVSGAIRLLVLYWTTQRAASLDVLHQRVVRRAQPLADVERAHADHHRVESRQRRAARAQRALVEHGHVVADAPQARGNLVARPGEVADARAAGLERQRHQPHLGGGEPGLDRDVRVLDAHHAARESRLILLVRGGAALQLGVDLQQRRPRGAFARLRRAANVERELDLLPLVSRSRTAGTPARSASPRAPRSAACPSPPARPRSDRTASARGWCCFSGNIRTWVSGRTDTRGVISSGR